MPSDLSSLSQLTVMIILIGILANLPMKRYLTLNRSFTQDAINCYNNYFL